VPKTWAEGAAAVVVLGAVFAAGGVVINKLFPSDSGLSWQNRVDRVCYREYGEMAAARDKDVLKQDTGRLRAEEAFVAGLEGVRQHVPIDVILTFNGLVNSHRRLVQLRREIVSQDMSQGRASKRLRAQLRDAQNEANGAVGSEYEGDSLGLSVCGHVGVGLE
jgi:hypothetical protein